MPKATQTDTTTMRVTPGRRGFLLRAVGVAGAAAVALPRAALAAGAGPDAELLALAAEFHTVDTRLQELGAPDAPDGVWESDGRDVHDRWWEIVNKVIDLPAYTVPGWATKGGVFPAVLRDLVGLDSDTADHKLALSLVRDLTGQNDGSPDVGLLAACEAFHAAHREMKAGRGDTPEHEAALGRAIDAWYAAIATVKAIPAHTPAGQQAKARVVFTALHDVLPIEEEDGHREEFAALAFLAEVIGDELTRADRPHPDADLIAACAAMDALSAEFDADPRDHLPGGPEEDARFAADQRIKTQMHDALARIECAPCTTLDGARTLARTLLREFPDTLKDLDDGMINHGLQRALIGKLIGEANLVQHEPGFTVASAPPTRSLSVLEIGHHLREASDRYDAVRDGASRWLLDELLGWRRLALTRQPATLCDAAAQLGVLFDHLGELDTHLLEGRPETLDLRNDLSTIERVVAGLAVTVARIAGLDLTTTSEDSLPDRLARHVPALDGFAGEGLIMQATTDPTVDVATRFLADLRANTTRTTDRRDDPVWHAMAWVAWELFGEEAGKLVILAARCAARSPEEIAADRAEVAAAIEMLGAGAPPLA